MLNKLETAYLAKTFAPPLNGAEHSLQLQPLGPEWRAGERFDDSKLPICRCDGPWFRIPSWLAGTWKPASDMVTQTYVADMKNHTEINGEQTVSQSNRPERWAMIKDRQGTFWQHPCIPSVMRDTSRGIVTIDVGVRYQPVDIDSHRVVTYYRWITFAVGNDYKIRSTKQSELISTYTPIGTGFCQKNESLKEFDDKGQPLRIARFRFNLTQTSPPSCPARDASGRDYLAMFRKWSTDNKLTDLIP
jgi:hypothetical protein